MITKLTSMKSKELPIKFNHRLAIFIICIYVITCFTISSQIQEHPQASATSDNLSSIIPLRVENLSVTTSPTGLVLVEGTVVNNSTTGADNIKVEAKLFDINDNLIWETIRFVTPPSSTFEPEARQQFDFLISAENIGHHNITAYGDRIQ